MLAKLPAISETELARKLYTFQTDVAIEYPSSTLKNPGNLHVENLPGIQHHRYPFPSLQIM